MNLKKVPPGTEKIRNRKDVLRALLRETFLGNESLEGWMASISPDPVTTAWLVGLEKRVRRGSETRAGQFVYLVFYEDGDFAEVEPNEALLNWLAKPRPIKQLLDEALGGKDNVRNL